MLKAGIKNNLGNTNSPALRAKKSQLADEEESTPEALSFFNGEDGEGVPLKESKGKGKKSVKMSDTSSEGQNNDDNKKPDEIADEKSDVNYISDCKQDVPSLTDENQDKEKELDSNINKCAAGDPISGPECKTKEPVEQSEDLSAKEADHNSSQDVEKEKEGTPVKSSALPQSSNSDEENVGSSSSTSGE